MQQSNRAVGTGGSVRSEGQRARGPESEGVSQQVQLHTTPVTNDDHYQIQHHDRRRHFWHWRRLHSSSRARWCRHRQPVTALFHSNHSTILLPCGTAVRLREAPWGGAPLCPSAGASTRNVASHPPDPAKRLHRALQLDPQPCPPTAADCSLKPMICAVLVILYGPDQHSRAPWAFSIAALLYFFHCRLHLC